MTQMKRFFLIVFLITLLFALLSNAEYLFSLDKKIEIVGISTNLHWDMKKTGIVKKYGSLEEYDLYDEVEINLNNKEIERIIFEKDNNGYVSEIGFEFLRNGKLIRILQRIPINSTKDCKNEFLNLKNRFDKRKKLRRIDQKKVSTAKDRNFCQALEIGKAQWVSIWVYPKTKQKIILSLGRVYNESLLLILESQNYDQSINST